MRKNLVRFFPVILLILLVVWAGKGLFKYEVAYTQDLKHHLVRSYDAIITLGEGHFPLRWAGILNYECGVPMFNFYNPLLYYLVAVLYFFTSHILLSLKIVSFLSLFAGTVGFYLWIKEETDDYFSAIGGAILYLFAPYTFLLVFVRGSPEYLAYAIFPIVFYLYAKAFKAEENFKFHLFLFLAAFSGGLLAISHNVVFMFFMPILFIYLLLKILTNKTEIKKAGLIIFSYISILGLGAFFIFPAILEKGYTKLDIPIFNYQDHFPTLGQIINSVWGYGDSAIGTHDDAMSFQLGYAQWIVLIIAFVWIMPVAWKILRRYENRFKLIIQNIWIFAFLALSVFFLYLVLPNSLVIWQKISLLQTIQFSWRLLGICVFSLAALFAFLLARIKPAILKYFILLTVFLIAILGNRNHLLPQPVYENDLPFYRGLDQIGGRRRFLTANAETILAPNAKVSCYLTTPVVSTNDDQDKIDFEEISRGSTFGQIKLDLNKSKLKGDKIIFNLGYFPGMYRLYVNSEKSVYSDCEGRVCLGADSFNEGVNLISWRVGQTSLQNVFNIVTIVFLTIWGYIILKADRKNNEKNTD